MRRRHPPASCADRSRKGSRHHAVRLAGRCSPWQRRAAASWRSAAGVTRRPKPHGNRGATIFPICTRCFAGELGNEPKSGLADEFAHAFIGLRCLLDQRADPARCAPQERSHGSGSFESSGGGRLSTGGVHALRQTGDGDSDKKDAMVPALGRRIDSGGSAALCDRRVDLDPPCRRASSILRRAQGALVQT